MRRAGRCPPSAVEPEPFGRVPRLESAEQVVAELDALYAMSWRGLVFVVAPSEALESAP